MSFGTHTDQSDYVCKSTWPREAIQQARDELDRLEAKLDEEDQ